MNLRELSKTELEELMRALGEPKFRAGQIFGWLAKGIEDVAQMHNVPKTLQEKLRAQGVTAALPGVLDVQISALDGMRKYLFAMEDGNAIESVFMRYKYGNSICLSSQAGCRMHCSFCASGLNGLSRHLTAGEILGQLLAAERESGEKVNHVVIMGTGEPFDNYENVAKFIRMVNDPQGVNLGMRNITVSTCGLVPGIRRFAQDFPQVNLAISLHAPNDELRTQMMPINRRYPLDELLAACREYCDKTSRRITFEYTLVRGVNDSREMAAQLTGLLSHMLCHVNLIPLNAVKETGLSATDRQQAEKFRDYLEKHGIPATIRRELGDDIDGACGQLRLSVAKR